MFAGADPGRTTAIYTIAAEGGAPQQVVGEPASDVFPAGWTQDGKSIVFEKSWLKGSNNFQTDIEVLDLHMGKVSVLPGSESLDSPVLSPDGRFLAAATSDRQKLMLFDFAIQKWVELAKTDIGAVNWTRDGKYLYFDSGSGRDQAISRVHIADRKLERVTELKDFRRVKSDVYQWGGLTPDGAPLLLRDVGTHEVYALDLEAP